MQIYLACALTHVPREQFDDYSAFIHSLAQAIRDTGIPTVKYALTDSDPQLAALPSDQRPGRCYAWDRKMVEEADAVVAECSYPSTGLGIELQVACAKDIPILLCFRRDPSTRAAAVVYRNPDQSEHYLQIGEGYLSLMVLGIPSIVDVVGYATMDEGRQRTTEALTRLLQVSQHRARHSTDPQRDVASRNATPH